MLKTTPTHSITWKPLIAEALSWRSQSKMSYLAIEISMAYYRS